MPTRQERDLRDDAISALRSDPLVDHARRLAEELLAGMDSRWRHSEGVAARAAGTAGAVAEADRPLLVAAAWLHDIGYAEPLRRSTFHPLDGAWHLQETSWGRTVAGLVAHHSGARFVAAVRGLDAQLGAFDETRYGSGPLPDALTYADQTTSPDGEPIDVESRLADTLRRHGPDSPSARAHEQRGPMIRAAVRRTEERLRSAG